MATDPKRRSALNSIAAHLSWADTPDRAARTAPGHRASPVSRDYWRAKIRAEGKVREQDIEAAAQNAHSAYMRQMRLRRGTTTTTPPRSSERRSA